MAEVEAAAGLGATVPDHEVPTSRCVRPRVQYGAMISVDYDVKAPPTQVASINVVADLVRSGLGGRGLPLRPRACRRCQPRAESDLLHLRVIG